MSLRAKQNNEKLATVDPAAAASAANASNLRLLGAQSRYLTHLRQQMTKLRDHSGAFGSVRYDLERRKEQALQMESSLVEAEEALLGPSLNSNVPTFPVIEQQPATTPDLESLASHLESLARHIQEMESLADTQGASLKKDLARVMEVFEDPGAFLPTPLKQPPTITPIQDTSAVIPPLDTSGILRSSRSSREGILRSTRFSPQSSSRSITSPRNNQQQQQEEEKPISSFHRVGDTIIVAPKDLDFDEPLSISPLLPSMATGDSVVGSIIQANPDPEDSLEAFRASIAHDIHSWRCGKTLAEAQEEIRRLGREASSNGQAAQKLHALTNKIDPKKSSRRSGLKSKQSEAENVAPAVNARDPNKKRAVKSMSNPDLYPWTAQLQDIFKGVRMDPNAPPGVVPPPAAMAFGGLAQSIPAFLEYQQYLQQQILAQEKERQAEEARKLEEEKKEAAAAAAAAIAAAKKAKKLAQQALENANTPSQLVPVDAPTHPVPALALPTVQHSVAAIQTSPRFHPGSSAWPHGMMGAPLSTDGRPSQQVFGQHIPRFDAIWEVLPSNRDAAVQSEASSSTMTGPPTARSIVVPSTIPSLPGSPRAPRHIIAASATEPHQQGHIVQTGRGQTPVGSPRAKKKSALSAIDQAALDLQAQAKQRGEGLSSNKALEQLMQIAGQDHHHVPPHHGEADTSAVLPHPLFSSNPAQQLAHYPNGKLLNLVMQMYDMPSEAQVDAEWKRVLTQEEEQAEEERKKKEAQEGEPVEQLSVPASTVDEQKPSPLPFTHPAAKPPSSQTEEKKYDSDYEPETVDEQQQQQDSVAREVAAAAAAIVAQREAAELEAAKKRADELEQARLKAELEAAKLALELQRVKDESAAAIAAAQRQHQPQQQSVPVAEMAPGPASVAAAPAQPQVSMEEIKTLWENEARARWAAEQEKLKAEAALAAAQASQQVAAPVVSTVAAAAPVESAAVTQQHPPHHHHHHASSSVDPALAAELAKLRVMNAAESSILDKVREEEQSRWEKENARREEERARLHRLHEEEERRFEARKKEREAEESRRRELERRRDELLQQKMDLEQQKTRVELETLRADMERLKARAQAVPIEPAFVDRAPLSGYRPRRPLDESDSSFSTSDELMSTGESHTGRHDLSEGEIDLGGARSPGLLVPPSSHLRIGHKKPSSYKTRPMSAAVLHPPIPSATPQRPAPGQVLRPAPEQKYPHPAEFQSARDPYDNLVRDPQRVSLGSSSTRDDIADLLRQSQDLRESSEIESVLNGESAQPNASVQTQFNVPYNAAISSVKAALAAPSRQVIVGTASPPLIDSDLSKLVRDSIDAYDTSIGASTDNIGGLFGLGTDRPPLSSRSTGSAAGLANIAADESLDEHDLSFNSPKMTATEQWLKSLKDQDD